MTISGIAKRAAWSAGHLKDVRVALSQTINLLAGLGRDQLATELAECRDRLGADVHTTVVLAGEFKSGKSSLINALVGDGLLRPSPVTPSVVPVVVRHGPDYEYFVVKPDGKARRIEGRLEFQRIATAPPEDLTDVARLEARVPSDLLAAGIVLVDTPSLSGGISSAAGGMVLSYIRASDALVLVSDASQELTASQAEFVRLAADIGQPVIISALTKIDLYHHWREIKEANQQRLGELDTTGVVLPVSSMLFSEGMMFKDKEALAESNVDVLRWYLAATLVADVVQAQSRRALEEAGALLAAARASLDVELAAGLDGADASRIEAQLLEHQRFLEKIGKSLLNEISHEISLHQERVNDQLDQALTSGVLRDANQLIEKADPLHGWSGIRDQIIRDGNTAMAHHLRRMDAGLQAVIDQAVTRANLSAADLGFDRRPTVQPPSLTGKLDPLDGSKRPRPSNLDIARSGLTGLLGFGGGVTLVGGTIFGLGSFIAPPAVAAAGLAGLVIAIKGSVDKRTETDIDQSRMKAKELARNYVYRLLADLRTHSRMHNREVANWVQHTLTKQQQEVRGRVDEDIERLSQAKARKVQSRDDWKRSHSEAIESVRNNAALIEKLLFTLARPEMEEVRR